MNYSYPKFNYYLKTMIKHFKHIYIHHLYKYLNKDTILCLNKLLITIQWILT